MKTGRSGLASHRFDRRSARQRCLGFLAASILSAACKPKGYDSEVKSLETLSGGKFKRNVCGGRLGDENREEVRQLRIHVKGGADPSLAGVMRQTLSGLPGPLLEFFHYAPGEIEITPNAAGICRKVLGTTDQESRKVGPRVELTYEDDADKSCAVRLMSKEPGLVDSAPIKLFVEADPALIRHLSVRQMGDIFLNYVAVKVMRTLSGIEFQQVGPIIDAEKYLTDAYFRDLLASGVYSFQSMDKIFGPKAGAHLMGLYLGDQLLPSHDILAPLKAVISPELVRTSPELAAELENLFPQIVLKEAFDQYFCNAAAPADLNQLKSIKGRHLDAASRDLLTRNFNTRAVLTALFPKTERAFTALVLPVIEAIPSFSASQTTKKRNGFQLDDETLAQSLARTARIREKTYPAVLRNYQGLLDTRAEQLESYARNYSDKAAATDTFNDLVQKTEAAKNKARNYLLQEGYKTEAWDTIMQQREARELINQAREAKYSLGYLSQSPNVLYADEKLRSNPAANYFERFKDREKMPEEFALEVKDRQNAALAKYDAANNGLQFFQQKTAPDLERAEAKFKGDAEREAVTMNIVGKALRSQSGRFPHVETDAAEQELNRNLRNFSLPKILSLEDANQADRDEAIAGVKDANGTVKGVFFAVPMALAFAKDPVSRGIAAAAGGLTAGLEIVDSTQLAGIKDREGRDAAAVSRDEALGSATVGLVGLPYGAPVNAAKGVKALSEAKVLAAGREFATAGAKVADGRSMYNNVSDLAQSLFSGPKAPANDQMTLPDDALKAGLGEAAQSGKVLDFAKAYIQGRAEAIREGMTGSYNEQVRKTREEVEKAFAKRDAEQNGKPPQAPMPAPEPAPAPQSAPAPASEPESGDSGASAEGEGAANEE